MVEDAHHFSWLFVVGWRPVRDLVQLKRITFRAVLSFVIRLLFFLLWIWHFPKAWYNIKSRPIPFTWHRPYLRSRLKIQIGRQDRKNLKNAIQTECIYYFNIAFRISTNLMKKILYFSLLWYIIKKKEVIPLNNIEYLISCFLCFADFS